MSHTPYLLRRYIDILNEQLHEDPEAATSAASEPPDEDEKSRIIALQKELKARGANLGTFGPAKDGIDGIIGKFTRNAAAKFPDIAKKYSDVLAAGVSGMPPAQPAQDPQVAKLLSSLGALEAVLAKYQIKAEDISADDAEVLENINQFSPQEQMEIWRLLAEEKPRMPAGTRFDRATGNYYTMSPSGAKTYIGGSGAGAPSVNLQQPSKLGKFISKLGGGRGIAKKVATRVAGSAIGGPAAPFLALGAAAWTAYDLGKALYDTFATTDLEELDPQDQEIVKRNMAVVLQYEKNPETIASLDPEVKVRLERVLKGLNKLAVQADSDPAAQT